MAAIALPACLSVIMKSQSNPPAFAKYVQSGIGLVLNQAATVDVALKTGGVTEVVNVVENASILNTTNTEVGTRFDNRRLAELPISTNRNVYNIALSAPGVSQLQSNQAGFTNGINYSSNGGRLRSNNFLLDGQDNNDFGVGGGVVQLNNPDLIQEVRLVTNQFSAEYGRNSSSVFNAITKSGSNEYHGSGFWFHNDNHLNACSNLNKNGGFCNKASTNPANQIAPFRVENQAGLTFGGPLHLPRFGEGGPSISAVKIAPSSSSRCSAGGIDVWARASRFKACRPKPDDRSSNSKLEIDPRFKPCWNSCRRRKHRMDNPDRSPSMATLSHVPLGSLTGSSSFVFNDWQQSIRVDHRLSNNHTLNGRYIYQDQDTVGAGQSTPSGYESANVSRNQGVNIALNSILSPKMVNELRVGLPARARVRQLPRIFVPKQFLQSRSLTWE